jgi:glyoxylase-like metal-dependent hydrolase (beta-lactamase superfamily II)
VGEHRTGLLPPADRPFLDVLAEAGYGVEDIDSVVCTHLHFDHVGWNTRLVDGEWVVTFPAARYLFGRTEWEHWSVTEGAYMNVGDTVRPVVDAGQADLVDADHRVCEQVRLVPTPGHTPGHVSVVVESGDDRAVITGDLAHHPIQIAEPDLASAGDSDAAQAAATRRTFLADRAADGALVIGTHFAGPTAGRVTPDGDGWALDC